MSPDVRAVRTLRGSPIHRRHTTPAERATLRVLTCLLVATTPVEGYLAAVHPDLPKLPAALLVLAWAVWRTRRRQWPPVDLGTVALVALSTVVCASAALHLDVPSTLPAAVRWLSFLLITYVLVDLFSTVVQPRDAALAFVLGALVAGAGGIAGFALGAGPDTRAAGPIGDPNDLAYVLVSAVPFVLLVGRRTADPRRGTTRTAALQAVALLVLLTGTALTLSRGALVGLAACVLIVLLLRPRLVRLRMLVVLGALSLLGAIALVATSYDELARAVDGKEYVADVNVETRADRWLVAVEMIGREPLLGIGPGGFRTGYDRIVDATEPSAAAGVAHQMYLETGAELGVLGLAIFLALCAMAVVANERTRRRGDDSGLHTVLHAGLGAVLVTSFFLSEQFFLPLWFMIAVGLSLEVRDRRAERPGWR